MEENLTIDYLTIGDIYMLQEETDTQIFIGGEVDMEAFSEAIRTLIEKGRCFLERRQCWTEMWLT